MCSYIPFSVQPKWISYWAFKWASVHHHSLMGYKNVTCQSWRAKKFRHLKVWGYFLSSKFHFFRPKFAIFLPPTLTGQNFATFWAMIMRSSSFESPRLIKSGEKNGTLSPLRSSSDTHPSSKMNKIKSKQNL